VRGDLVRKLEPGLVDGFAQGFCQSSETGLEFRTRFFGSFRIERTRPALDPVVVSVG